MIVNVAFKIRKKLIEVALPLEAINKAAADEKGNPFLKGHPRNLHQWWARRPAAAARAVIFAQMVDDPSSVTELFSTGAEQEKERERLFGIIEDLVRWENSNNALVLKKAQDEIWKTWRRACADNATHPRAAELFDVNRLPVFHDPFAGGGALPLEAQRLGLEAWASDLNPVAVLLNKVMIEIAPRFAGKPPVNPTARSEKMLMEREWKGAQGFAEDVRYYGQWMRDEGEKRIGHLYPKVEITAEMAKDRPDLLPYRGQKLKVIAWLWARTVKSPNPAFADVEIPLASTFMLSTKTGKEAYVEPVIEGSSYRFNVRLGKPDDVDAAKRGTKSGSSGSTFLCIMSGTPIPFEYLRSEAKAGRMRTRLMALVAEGGHGRFYLPPTTEMEAVARHAMPHDPPETDLPPRALGFRVQEYGMKKWRDLFTPRQLEALTTLSDLVADAMLRAKCDAVAAGSRDDGKPLRDGGSAATAYGEAVGILQALALDKFADYNNTICTWNPTNQNIGHLFTKQAIPMAWDFPETTPFDGGLSFSAIADGLARSLEQLGAFTEGKAFQHDCAAPLPVERCTLIATDPPYYDNIGYADLSDFFYNWLRRSLRAIFPDLFATLAVPKAEELIATQHRHSSREKAETFFLDGMTRAMNRLAEQTHPSYPVVVFYAFKQSEGGREDGASSTGWETFLDAMIRAGFSIDGTWPVRTERHARSVGQGTNALASSIVIVCRGRETDAPTATRREFLVALKTSLPSALRDLQAGNITPVDLAQAAIGPGMAVYTRYSKVFDTEGRPVPVRDALALINQTLDEVLTEQEGDFDADSRWALAWFDQHGFGEGEYGVAETLSKAKNTSVAGLVNAGILQSRRGKVRLLKAEELPADWDPISDPRLNAWESVHHLIRALVSGGEGAAAVLAARLGAKAEPARELAYRLYAIAERNKRGGEALEYNGLVQSWPEIAARAREGEKKTPSQANMFEVVET